MAIGQPSDFFGEGALDSSVGERTFGPAVAGKTVQVLGNPDLPHTYTYVTDITSGLVLLGERPEALGQAWRLPSAPAVVKSPPTSSSETLSVRARTAPSTLPPTATQLPPLKRAR